MAQFNFRMPTIRSAAGAMAIAMIVTSILVAVIRPLQADHPPGAGAGACAATSGSW